MATQELNVGNFTDTSRQQIMDNRLQLNKAQNALFKNSGGAGPTTYSCPTTFDSTTQDKLMADVCKTNNFASVINSSTQKAGKLKRKTKKRKNKKKKSKKKSKRRK